MKIKAVLIDDETHALNTLRWELEKHCPQVEIVGEFNQAEKALGALNNIDPDLVFLDIEMPIMNGFDLLDQLDRIDFEVIFVTAFDQYAVQAFRLNAIDYLLKPIDHKDLLEAISRVRFKSAENNREERNRTNLELLKRSFRKIPIHLVDRLEFVLPDEILYCKSEGSYTYVVFSEKEVLITKPLKEMEKKLQDFGFFRTHKSYLVNLHHITKYIRGEGGYLIVSNGDSVPVARRKKDELTQLF